MPVKADASMLTDDAGVIDGSWLRHRVKLGQPGVGNVVSQQRVRSDDNVTDEEMDKIRIPAVLSTQPLHLSSHQLHSYIQSYSSDTDQINRCTLLTLTGFSVEEHVCLASQHCRQINLPHLQQHFGQLKNSSLVPGLLCSYQAIVELVPQLCHRVEVVASVVTSARGPMVANLHSGV